jgi:hypothetical protein
MSRAVVAVLAGVVSLAFVDSGRAEVWRVNAEGTGDVPTIQAAIQALDHGDTIRLADGVYTGAGNRDLYNSYKWFFLQSASGDPEACIIDCQGSQDDPHWGISYSTDG